jgi:hypothetical protein
MAEAALADALQPVAARALCSADAAAPNLSRHRRASRLSCEQKENNFPFRQDGILVAHTQPFSLARIHFMQRELSREIVLLSTSRYGEGQFALAFFRLCRKKRRSPFEPRRTKT